MIINNTEVLPGESKKIEVNIAKLPSHTPIDISINVSMALKPGPVLLLMGGLHGDEVNGIEIVRRIIEQGNNVPERGVVICIPILNIYGFIHFSRYAPDGKDVNRSFPGNKNGSLASRVAYYLMKDIIPKIDYGIDFHTGGADRTNYPQIRCMMDNTTNQELAKAFCAPFTMHAQYRPKSLRHSAAKQGKNILVYEGGESARFDEFAIQEGVNGALRVMKHLGIMSFKLKKPSHEYLYIRNSSWIRARFSGIFQSAVASGEHIVKNQLVGYITDPFGEFKHIVKSLVSGYVIGLNNDPIVHQGDALIHLGVLK